MIAYGLKKWRLPEIVYNKEHGLIMLVLMLFLFSSPVLRWVDFTAAPLDMGILSAILLAIFGFLLFKLLTWWLIRHVWPVLGEYSIEHFERNFKSLLSWQKVIIYLSFYLFLLYGFVFTFMAVI